MSNAQERWQLLQSNPTLTQLAEACPQAWLAVRGELAAVYQRNDSEEIRTLLEKNAMRQDAGANFLSGERHGRAFEAFVERALHQRLTELALRDYAFARATGIARGKVKLGWYSGLLAQWLFFSSGLTRKPVSLQAYRWIWPLIRQKRLLLPLVEKRGIYCFYSKELIAALARLIGTQSALEIGAGDGTLSRFLHEAGCRIIATDDYSWQKVIRYPESVKQLDAIEAIKTCQPHTVICSWPPAGNAFEKQIFRQPSVERYIVLGSQSRFLTGNWAEYEAQTNFTLREIPELAQTLLPQMVRGGVWVFERRH